jgi:hypothetical protein
MRKMAIPLVLVALAALTPVGTASAAPAGPETNPVGTLRWLPDNTNEKPAAGLNRLVVIYDRSLNSAGKPSALLAKGAFGLKIATTSPDLRMKGHSPAVGSIEDAGGPAELDELFVAVEGDIRDGACSNVGTAGFSAAFTSTRTFLHQGSSPYTAQSGPGACEVVDSSTPANGGFQTRVTTHVPGFWIDVEWPVHDETGGQLLPEVWYEAIFDTGGESGDFYETSDTAGSSKSISVPGLYDLSFTATAVPGGFGAPTCPGLGPDAPAGTYQDFKFTPPAGTKKVVIELYPKLDWDMKVIDPEGNHTNSGENPGTKESAMLTVVPGEYTVRACNWAGEPTVFGSVDFLQK